MQKLPKLLKKNRKGEYKFVPKPKYDKGELVKEILRAVAVGGIFAMALAAPNVAQLAQFLEPADRRKVRRVIKSLRDRRLVRLVSRGDRDYFEVTEGGRRQLTEYDIDDMVLNKSKRWDGVWRIVMFDVPHQFRNARDALQFKLRELGFYRYQKSIYITPHRCRDEIDFIACFFHIERCVKYVEVDELEDEITLVNHFELDQPY